MRGKHLLSFATLALFLTQPILAQESRKTPSQWQGLEYRQVGPYAGGRVSRACGIPGDPLTYYLAAASGGVWKSTDGGLRWKPIFDDQPTASIGSIAVAPSDPNVVYVGTGEANIRGNASPGLGIFRSTDAGKTWQHVWKQLGQIGTMAIHPKDSNIAYAAVLGHAFGPNPQRGVYRTNDGGKTWNCVLFKNDDTGCSDIAIDPANPRNVYAGFWQTRRRPWDMTSGGPGSDFFVSRDGGETWTSLKAKGKKIGLPEGIWGKVGVTVAPSKTSRVYAVIEHEKGGLFRSDDNGETWQQTSDNRTLRQRAWYYSTLTVHPTNPDVIYAPQVPMLKSSDGGKTFGPVRGFHHGDHHDIWIDPANPDRMIAANDGGVDISTDGGKTWYAPPLPLSQFYHVRADNRTPYHIMGCMQDLGSAAGPSHSLSGAGIGLGDWYNVGGGEAGHAVPDPRDPNIVYAGEYGGIMTRYDHRTRQARNVTVNQWNPSGIDPAKHPYRFQWTAPILVSQHTPNTVYHAGNVIFRTTDSGLSWKAISGDLTRNDKQKQQWSGGPITGDNTGAETYCTVFALSESPKQKGILWAGSDDGLVHVSTDDAATWTNVTPAVTDLPDWGTVACIEPSPHDAKTAYLVVDNHRMDDYRPHLWKTTDLGKTWTKLAAGLANDVHLHVVREDPKKKNQLYLGSERGIMISSDGGKTWKSLQLNLPTVAVHDLVVKGSDLVVATHGRSLWILDDISILRHWKPALADKPLHLYESETVTKYATGGGNAIRYPEAICANPKDGASVWFHTAKLPKEPIVIEIRDDSGKLVAKAKGKPGEEDKDDEEKDETPPAKERKFGVKAGLNRFIWDLTYEGAETIPGSQVDAGLPSIGIPVLPGEYLVEVHVGKEISTTTITVKPDPRFDVKVYDPAQIRLALTARDQLTTLTRTVTRIRAIQKQITFRKELLKDRDDAKKLVKDSEALGNKYAAIEEKLHNPKAKIVYDIFAARGGAMLYSQFTWLLSNLTDGDGPPTEAQKTLAEDLAKQLTTQSEAFEKLSAEVAKLNEAAKKLNVPELYIPPMKTNK